MSVAELQSRLYGNAQALDPSVGDDLLRVLRTLDNELEMIIFGVPHKDEPAAALALLDRAAQLIRARLDEAEVTHPSS